MTTVIGVFLGMILGFLFMKKQGERRMYEILLKSGMSEVDLQQFMGYYKNYAKVQKEAKKAFLDNATRMEIAYNLQKNVVTPLNAVKDNVSNVERVPTEEKNVSENVPQL